MKKTKLTIITACLNAEHTIEKTIQSVVNQLTDEIQYIIIDGASRDKTVEIANKYKQFIHSIISEPDHGISDAFNKGISMANGEYIGILNADDELTPNAISSVINAIDSNEAEIYCFSMQIAKENTSLLVNSKNERLYEGMYVAHPATFVKSSVYKKIGYFNNLYKYAMDYDFLLRAKISGITFKDVKFVTTKMKGGGISDRKPIAAAIECIKAHSNHQKSQFKNLKFGIIFLSKRLVFRLLKGF